MTIEKETSVDVAILISADAEWRAVQKLLPGQEHESSPYGTWFYTTIPYPDQSGFEPVLFFHGGWGKIAAAGSTQYVIDHWQPKLLINLGTCGGFEGDIEQGDILLVEKTIVYDLIEQMADNESHIEHYTTDIDLSWVGEKLPIPVRRSLLVSGDRDLLVEDIPELRRRYGAVAGDWESAAVAFVAKRNNTHLLILRGVTDVVGSSGSEAYGNLQVFEQAAERILEILINSLPGWLSVWNQKT